MSDAIIVALIGAIPSLLTFAATMVIVRHAWHIPAKLNEIVQNTNGMADQLIAQTASVARVETAQKIIEAANVVKSES